MSHPGAARGTPAAAPPSAGASGRRPPVGGRQAAVGDPGSGVKTPFSATWTRQRSPQLARSSHSSLHNDAGYRQRRPHEPPAADTRRFNPAARRPTVPRRQRCTRSAECMLTVSASPRPAHCCRCERRRRREAAHADALASACARLSPCRASVPAPCGDAACATGARAAAFASSALSCTRTEPDLRRCVARQPPCATPRGAPRHAAATVS